MTAGKSILHHKWDNDIARDWKWVVPPGRPSLSELAVYDRYLSSFPTESRILILGSTPEFRDLAYCHSFDVTVVDYNRGTFDILTEQMRHPNMERLIHEDWRDMQLDQVYDVAIGDLVINMVPYEDQKPVIQNVKEGLKERGLFIHRVWIRLAGVYTPESTDLESIIREHQTSRKGMHYFYSLALPLISYFFDQKEGYVSFQTVLRGLEKAYAEGLIDNNCLNSFTRTWHRYLMPNWLPEKDCLERTLKEEFDILETTSGTDFFKEFCPIYVMSTRGARK